MKVFHQVIENIGLKFVDKMVSDQLLRKDALKDCESQPGQVNCSLPFYWFGEGSSIKARHAFHPLHSSSTMILTSVTWLLLTEVIGGQSVRNNSKVPNVKIQTDEIAAQGQVDTGRTCVEKVMMREETRYEEVMTCDHSYDERCHTSYVTSYQPHQEEECDENFRKVCISFICIKRI